MKRLITVICLMAATTMIIGTEESQAQSGRRNARSTKVQRSGGGRARARNNVSRRQSRNASRQSFGRNRATPTRMAQKTSSRKPVNRGQVSRKPVNRPSQGSTRPANRPSTRPRPFPKPGNGGVKPQPRPTRPGNGSTRPRPFPRPGNGGIKPLPRPRPNPGGGIKPLPRPRPTPGGGIKPLPRPRPTPGGGIKPLPRPRPTPGGGIKPLPRPFPKPLPKPDNGGIKPRPRPIDPVLGGGRPRPRPNRPWFKPGRRERFANHWCFARPTYCHWWFDYCTPLAYCDTVDIVSCEFIQCGIPEVILPGGEIINDAVWYLGLKGMVLPETGLGIDEVDPDSPAALAGLTAGMVIVRCNDIQITQESDMQQAIETSGGVLTMIVQLEDGSQAEAVVEMVRVSSVNI